MNASALYSVAVRELCEFTAKTGSLDLRFTPSPTAKEGLVGHTIVTGRRNQSYEKEVTLSAHYKQLHVRGRADGYNPQKNRLEEIKTYRGDLTLLPDNHRQLHWTQAKIYGWLMCQQRGLPDIELALVYFDVVEQKETSLRERFTCTDLSDFFESHCERFLRWATQELTHRASRDQALESLQFPYVSFRDGQRVLAEAVFRGASTGRCLLAQAPTGIGKTIGTLFPLFKAMPKYGLDKVFFLTAKTPGRQLALDAVQQLAVKPLRTLELRAREKSCEHPDKSCHGDSCPLAKGFYDRLPTARDAAAEALTLDQTRLREVALAHNICPYYLGQEMVRWSDIVIGDYNYYFDQTALLYGLTANNSWKAALLIDEAHNLVDRARAMYSADLNQHQFREVKKDVPQTLKNAFNKLSRQWNALNRETQGSVEIIGEGSESYCLLGQLPPRFLDSLQAVTAAMTDYFMEQPFALDSKLTRFYFDALHFLRVEELFDDDTYVADCTWRGQKSTTLSLRNLIPAAHLQKRFSAARSVTLFSATLQPASYYRDVLGLPADTVQIDVPSPFSAAQLQVSIAANISTRYDRRSSSIKPIGDLIAQQYDERPGNYLVFFSSYQYLQEVLDYLTERFPNLPLWGQDRRMNEAERSFFLQRFESQRQGIGFAVLGGAFAEGIDLPGERLIGAFIVTLGLPQRNEVNEQLKERMETVFGEGYNYAYLYPGLTKVIQAAGRVIRSESDRGIVHLVDDRFAHPKIKAMLPSWWQLK